MQIVTEQPLARGASREEAVNWGLCSSGRLGPLEPCSPWGALAQSHRMSVPPSSGLSDDRENRASAQHKATEAKKTLVLWKRAYFETRAKIEASGREARWEFDRKRLFERTDYMASICQDLSNILQVGRLECVCFSTCAGG